MCKLGGFEIFFMVAFDGLEVSENRLFEACGQHLVAVLARIGKVRYDRYDFFYIHFKGTDRAGEDGDFEGKVEALEELDRRIPAFLELQPDVLIVTGDHSTPAVLKGHSWHPVPVLLWSRWSHPDGVRKFTERECAAGSLGRLRAVDLMAVAMANALRFKKFGA